MPRRVRRRPAAAVEARLGAGVASLYAWLARNRVTRGPWAVTQTFSKADGTLLSGSMAFYTFLSLLPLLIVAGFVVGILARLGLDVREGVVMAIDRAFPTAQAGSLVGELIAGRLALGIVGVITLVYASSGFVGALTACLNRMWGVTTGRNPVGQKLLNLGIVTALGFLVLASVALTLWARYLAGIVFGQDAGLVVAVTDRLGSPVSLLLTLVVLYRVLPARRQAWRSQLPGAVFATLGIELVKGGFTFWARNSAGVSTLPRSVLSVVLFLVWFGLLSQLILYGAAINVVRSGGTPPA